MALSLPIFSRAPRPHAELAFEFPRRQTRTVRIASLLPSATETLFALGLGDSIVGVTHECDFPPEAAKKLPLICPRVDPAAALAELDRQVRELMSRGESIVSSDGWGC